MGYSVITGPNGEVWDTYAEYRGSKAWEDKRQKVFKKKGHLCICGKPAVLVHHNTYDRIGHEKTNDLIPLCLPCHDLIHKEGKRIVDIVLSARAPSYWGEEDLDKDPIKDSLNSLIDKIRSKTISTPEFAALLGEILIGLGEEPKKKEEPRASADSSDGIKLLEEFIENVKLT
jgi:hypothetical protein